MLGEHSNRLFIITRLRILIYKLIYHFPKSRQDYKTIKPIESVWSTFMNIKPVWFDLEQSLYLKQKNYGKELSRVDLSPLTEVALIRAW